jgi:hypothetical protein
MFFSTTNKNSKVGGQIALSNQEYAVEPVKKSHFIKKK